MVDVNYWARPSVAFIRCDTCRDETIAKCQLLVFCAGTLRVPPNFWAERTAKHVEAIQAGRILEELGPRGTAQLVV
jgi:hypothetical protein